MKISPARTDDRELAVLIPHFNDIKGLNTALSSLAGENATVIVVDDGSATPPQQCELAASHPHLRSLHIILLAENIGIAQALNVGLSYANEYEYIARLDCGDESLPGRLVAQKAYLDDHPQCHLVGSWAEYVDVDSGKSHVRRYPCKHQQIYAAMYRCNVFCHPATMFRRSSALALGDYPTNYPAAEDYALFFSMTRSYQVANLPEVYVRTHTCAAGISSVQVRRQIVSSIRILLRHLRPGHFLLAARGIAVAAVRLLLGTGGTAAVKATLYPRDFVDGNRGPYSGQAM